MSVTEYLTVESRWLTWTELMSDCKPADASIITSLRKLPSKDIQNRELQPLVRNFVAQHLDWNSTPSHLYVIKHVAPSKTFQTFSESNWNCVKPAHLTPVGVFHIEASGTVSASRVRFTPFFTSVIRARRRESTLMFRCLFQVEHTRSRKHIPSPLQLFSINKVFSSDPVPPSNVGPDTLAGDYNS